MGTKTKTNNKKIMFFLKLFISLATIVAIVFCAYLALDKLIVPKYFKDYGISNMHDLVAMMKTLYNTPDEKDMLTNGYTLKDQRSAVDKLINIKFPTKENNSSELDYFKIADGFDTSDLVKGQHIFSDREIAGILDDMLGSGVLAVKLPNIKYIDTININILEIIITPTVNSTEVGSETYDTNNAKVSFTFKFDTSAVRNQMATAMDTPLFLLNMIVPKTLYITVDYNIEKTADGTWVADEGFMGVNGRTVKDSQILLDLLIRFIFPEEDQMTIEKLSRACGSILTEGMGLLGDIKIQANINGTGDNGVVLTI